MSTDLSNLSGRVSSFPTKASWQDDIRKRALGDIEQIRKLLNPAWTIQSSAARALEEIGQREAAISARSYYERYAEDELRRLERYREIFSPSASAMKMATQELRELERFAPFNGAERALRDAAALAQGPMADAFKVVDPFRSLVDQLKTEQSAASWLKQLESAAHFADAFVESWPEDEAGDDDANWEALDQHLESVHAVIERLPSKIGSKRKLAKGLTRFEQITLILNLLTLLFGLLALVDSHIERRLDREQDEQKLAFAKLAHTEERELRERLIATIEAVATRAPPHSAIYVVGSRPVSVKSAITLGIYLGTASPGQQVLAKGRQGRWLNIWYHDSLEDREVEGWVPKHYLVRQAEGDDQADQ